MDDSELQERIHKLIRHLDGPLIKIRKPAVPALINALNDENGDVRASAAIALAEIADSPAVPALINALNDENAKVRSNAAYALAEIADSSAVPALITALNDENWIVRLYAAKALGKIADPSAKPTLINALNDENGDVRDFAIDALKRILDNLAITEEIQEFETGLQEGYDRLKKEHNEEDLTDFQIGFAKVKMAIAKRKNELAADKGVLLDDKPKPPKKGIYQQIRRIRNG